MNSLLFFAFFLITTTTTTTAIDATYPFTYATTPPQPPPPPQPPQSPASFSEIPPPFSILTPILTDLGYHDLAMAAHTLSLSSSSPSLPWLGPTTIFAPADRTVRTCPSCSLPLLLQEHTVPGLYPLDYLRKLTFGTKIETILPGRCLTVTSAVNGTQIYVGGAEVTRPDLFTNAHITIHGVQGFASHLSPFSCSIDRMTSLSLPSPSSALTRMMLFDAMIRLKTSRYSILALALRAKFPDLVVLNNMTIFAVDDHAIFNGGHSYIHDVKFHIVPNYLLRLSDLEKIPAPATLPTLLAAGETLKVTSSPVRINYVPIKIPDLMYNMKMAVHGLSLPFPRHRPLSFAVSGEQRSESTTATGRIDLGRPSVFAPSTTKVRS